MLHRLRKLTALLPAVGGAGSPGQFLRTAIVGVVNTAIGLALLTVSEFAVFAWIGDPLVRNTVSVTVAYLISVTLSFLLNRWWSFQLSGSAGTLKEYASFVAANALSWLVPIVTWAVVRSVASPPDETTYTLGNLAITIVILPLKFVLFRYLVFARALAAQADVPATPVGREVD